MPASRLAQSIATAPRLHTNDYPLWQGPCGEGPLGGITQSMLIRFLSCRERFRLKYILGLEPHDRWNHCIGYGHMWHTCEEANAANRHHFDALSQHSMEMWDRYPLQRDEIGKWHNVCCVQFPVYLDYWSEHPDVKNRTPLLQEQVFDIPYNLPSGRVVRLRGKWDSVDMICDEVTGPQGGIYLQENKTKGDIDRAQVERQLSFDLQTMMYLIALRSDKNPEFLPPIRTCAYSILGVRYNVVRRPLSGGKGSITPHKAKSFKGSYTPAETEEEFYERLRRDYIAAEPDYWFFRIRAEVSDKDIQVFRDTCLDPILEQLCSWYEVVTSGKSIFTTWRSAAMNYRTPFGVYSALEEGGATEYDAFLETGSEAGLRRIETLFDELQ